MERPSDEKRVEGPPRFRVARNSDPDSRLPYLIWLPIEGGLVLKARETWPRASRVFVLKMRLVGIGRRNNLRTCPSFYAGPGAPPSTWCSTDHPYHVPSLSSPRRAVGLRSGGKRRRPHRRPTPEPESLAAARQAP